MPLNERVSGLAEVLRRSWGVDLNFKDVDGTVRHGLLGVLGFHMERNPMPWREGFSIATWATRGKARDFLRKKKASEPVRDDGFTYWKRALVVRLDIRINVVG